MNKNEILVKLRRKVKQTYRIYERGKRGINNHITWLGAKMRSSPANQL